MREERPAAPDVPFTRPVPPSQVSAAITYYWHTSLHKGLAAGLLPPIEATEVRQAAGILLARTAVGPDGWRPRDIGLLSDEAFTTLASLCNMAEVAAFPLGDLGVVILLKPGGGERPIGLLCTLLRFWHRCRRKCAPAW